MKLDWKKLAASILGCQFVGTFSSWVTVPQLPEWYASLNKPVFNPPDWVFGPVWITLYFMMGFALYLVWTNESPRRFPAIVCFCVQLFLNGLWSFVFFDAQNPFWGVIDIGLLWIAICLTTGIFWRISKIASVLMWPYWLWVSYATYLNWMIWQLNPSP